MELSDVEVRAANMAAQGLPIGPSLAPCVCGQPWHAHHGGLPNCGRYRHDPADALLWDALAAESASLVDDVAAYDDHLYAQRRRHRPPGPRVSDIGGCRRAVWYRELPPEDYRPLPVNRKAATIGSAFHDKAAAARAWRYPWRHHEMEVNVPGLDGVYYVDEYDPVTGLVIDDKTAGEGKWWVLGDEGPTDDMWEQVNIYALALDAEGWPVNRVQIIGVRREDGTEEHYTRLFDPQVALTALDRLTELADMLSLGIVPPRDGYGPSHWLCQWCPALAHCWQLGDAAAAGRSPESYVGLGPEPGDPTIVWAAAHAHELGRAASAAKAAYDQARKLLEGIPDGTYGGFVVKNQTRRMPDYKATHGRNLGYWVMDPDHRPDYETVANPEKRTDSYVTVTRERYAKRQEKVDRPTDGPPEGDPAHDIA